MEAAQSEFKERFMGSSTKQIFLAIWLTYDESLNDYIKMYSEKTTLMVYLNEDFNIQYHLK